MELKSNYLKIAKRSSVLKSKKEIKDEILFFKSISSEILSILVSKFK